MRRFFQPNGQIKLVVRSHDKKHLEEGWRERPWDLISAGVDPEYLGIPQLSAYLRAHPEQQSGLRLDVHWRPGPYTNLTLRVELRDRAGNATTVA
ncbi:MAG: hypothetical protein ACWGMZ_06620, partial [Thermoguttaceae bacterium]